MNGMILAFVLAGFSFDVMAAEVFKCSVDGKIEYTDTPCGGEAKSLAIPAIASPDNAATPALQPYELQREAGMGRVVVGQTADQVRQAWGEPKAVNVETDALGRTERWVYERSGGTSTVYLRAGKVVSLSTGPRSGDATTPVESPSKPTEEAIEAQVRAAKADGRRMIQKRWVKTQVLDAIGEPDRKEFIGIELWTYLPTPRDRQTVTTVFFDGDTVYDVQRKVVQ